MSNAEVWAEIDALKAKAAPPAVDVPRSWLGLHRLTDRPYLSDDEGEQVLRVMAGLPALPRCADCEHAVWHGQAICCSVAARQWTINASTPACDLWEAA